MSVKLETVEVAKLELGMVVHGIADQKGKLVVKNKGMIRHLSVIDQLINNGVKSVYIERSNIKASSLNVTEPKEPQNSVNENTSEFKKAMSTELSIELENSTRLIKQSHQIHQRFVNQINNQIDLDIQDAQELVSDVYASLARNPNALLCMTMVMDSESYLANHAIHVATLLCFFAQNMGMSVDECQRLAMLGYLYDIGMCRVPESAYNKTVDLSEEDEIEIQKHVQYSLDIVKPLQLDQEILLAIEQHHERLDGQGYPSGATDATIGKYSRMLAIADTYESLTAGRIYKKAKSPAAAMKKLCEPQNGFDQKLVMQFVRILGIYPVGSLVMLSNKRIALVIKNKVDKPNLPQIKVFYSLSGGHYLAPKTLDLSKQSNDIKILKPISPDHYNLELKQII